VAWTPTFIVLDPSGREQFRSEGYLPPREFRAALALGHARAAFQQKHFEVSEREFRELIEQYSDTAAAPEALYWATVSGYQRDHDPKRFRPLAEELQQKYPGSIWTKKAAFWLG
jgi:TolA-binding protein